MCGIFTDTAKINQMQKKLPYMDPMGNFQVNQMPRRKAMPGRRST